MLKRRKGVVEIIAITAILAIGLVTWLAGPQIIKAVGSLANGGDKNQAKNVRKVDSVRTVYQIDPLNPEKMIPIQEKYSEYTNDLQATQPPETLWEKFWKMGAMAVVIIVALSYLGILPIIRLWWGKNVKPKLLKAQEDMEAAIDAEVELRGDAKLIVISIDEGLSAMNASIASAKAVVDINQAALTNAALIEDQVQRTAAISNAQASLVRAQAIFTALSNLKTDFMAALSRKQDTTTKLLISELKND